MSTQKELILREHIKFSFKNCSRRTLPPKYKRRNIRKCSGLLNCACGCHYEAEFGIWRKFKDVVEGNVRGSGTFYLPTWLKLEFPCFHSPTKYNCWTRGKWIWFALMFMLLMLDHSGGLGWNSTCVKSIFWTINSVGG